MIARGLEFSDAKNIGEIPVTLPPTRTPNRGGVGSRRRFLTIARYISEMEPDMDIVSMEG